MSAHKTTAALLEERGKTHGDYENTAAIIQGLKKQFWTSAEDIAGKNTTEDFTNVQAESISMILHKLGRIASGDPECRDHWEDISGYAMLAANRCLR